jgi:hypothetical protein
VRLMARRSESGIGADEPPHLRSLVEHEKNKPHFRQYPMRRIRLSAEAWQIGD